MDASRPRVRFGRSVAAGLAVLAALWLLWVVAKVGDPREPGLGCGGAPAGRLPNVEIGYDWSWLPPGWTCLYVDVRNGRVLDRVRE